MNSEHTKQIVGGSGSGRKGEAADVAICGYTDSCDSGAGVGHCARERFTVLYALTSDEQEHQGYRGGRK
jgi:hypothetical protein